MGPPTSCRRPARVSVGLAVLAAIGFGTAVAGQVAPDTPPPAVEPAGGDPTSPAASTALPPPPQALTARVPPRPADAPTGSAFVERLRGVAVEARRRAILDELRCGNIPDFLRKLRPVELRGQRTEGRPARRAVVWVSPDYLAIGSDEDYVRIPVGFYTAVTVARSYGLVLPTRKIVDAVNRQADVRLAPSPMTPGPQMASIDYFLRHDRMIDEQLGERPPGLLVSGHKKDLVLTNRLAAKAKKVAIYGWHRKDGRAIQPLSTVHESRYADYSHGLRLVGATVLVDGEPRAYLDVLEDPVAGKLLTHEGTIKHARALMELPFDPVP